MSLADELLADLEENEDEDGENAVEVKEEAEEIKEEKPDVNALMEWDTAEITSVTELCKLRDSDRLQDIVQQIKKYRDRVRKASEIIGLGIL